MLHIPPISHLFTFKLYKERRTQFSFLPCYRLTPALAVVLLFQVSLINYLGSGPFWNSGNGYFAEVCRQNWAGTLTYLQNYIDADKIVSTLSTFSLKALKHNGNYVYHLL